MSPSPAKQFASHIPRVKELRQALGFGDSSLTAAKLFNDKLRSHRLEYKTINGTPGTDLYLWKSKAHQLELSQMATTFLETHGSTLWPEIPSTAENIEANPRLSYPRDQWTLHRILRQLIFRQNQQDFRNSKYKKDTAQSNSSGRVGDTSAEPITLDDVNSDSIDPALQSWQLIRNARHSTLNPEAENDESSLAVENAEPGPKRRKTRDTQTSRQSVRTPKKAATSRPETNLGSRSRKGVKRPDYVNPMDPKIAHHFGSTSPPFEPIESTPSARPLNTTTDPDVYEFACESDTERPHGQQTLKNRRRFRQSVQQLLRKATQDNVNADRSHSKDDNASADNNDIPSRDGSNAIGAASRSIPNATGNGLLNLNSNDSPDVHGNKIFNANDEGVVTANRGDSLHSSGNITMNVDSNDSLNGILDEILNSNSNGAEVTDGIDYLDADGSSSLNADGNSSFNADETSNLNTNGRVTLSAGVDNQNDSHINENIPISSINEPNHDGREAFNTTNNEEPTPRPPPPPPPPRTPAAREFRIDYIIKWREPKPTMERWNPSGGKFHDKSLAQVLQELPNKQATAKSTKISFKLYVKEANDDSQFTWNLLPDDESMFSLMKQSFRSQITAWLNEVHLNPLVLVMEIELVALKAEDEPPKMTTEFLEF
jgi:hypothetical protein